MKKEKIIEESKLKHTIEYDYSLVEDIKNKDEKIKIICPTHGLFAVRCSRFIKGCNCPKCANKCKKTTDEFKKEYNEKYGVYSLEKFEYVNSHTKSIATCKKHGDFEITPSNLLSNYGCPKCKAESLSKLFSNTNKVFTTEAIKIHGDRYEYIGEYVNNKTPYLLKCKKCGNEFFQTPNNHLQGKGCPYCNESHLEKEVEYILKELGIDFIYQQRFDWLGKQSLDFYIPSKNIAIECQGEQHFEQTNFGLLEENIKRDKIKFELCNQNGVKLYYYFNKKYGTLPNIYNENNTLNKFNIKNTLL